MINGTGVIAAGRAGVLAAVALACGVGAAMAGDSAGGSGAAAGAGSAAAAGSGAEKARPLTGPASGAGWGAPGKAEIVYFADPGHSPVRIMRGSGSPRSPISAPAPAQGPAQGS